MQRRRVYVKALVVGVCTAALLVSCGPAAEPALHATQGVLVIRVEESVVENVLAPHKRFDGLWHSIIVEPSLKDRLLQPVSA